MTHPIEPEVSCTFESTTSDPKEAVKVIWVTSDDNRSERLVMVGHQGGMATLTMEQWDAWCERCGARMWERDAQSIAECGRPWFGGDEE